jgi:hypothetical protein
MMNTVLRLLGGFCAFLILCEAGLQCLPVSASTAVDYYLDPLILSYPAHRELTVSTGWDLRNAQRLHANNAGFLADHDFVRDPNAVALIGDSLVEASMLPAIDRPGAQLERALGNRPVYALGAPGSALLDHAERIRFVAERYSIRDAVVLVEYGDLRQSLCGSGSTHGPCLDSQTRTVRTEHRAPAGLAKRILRHSALLQYLLGQLKIQPERLWRQALAQSRPATPLASPKSARSGAGSAADAMPERDVDAVTAAFFARIKGRLPGRLILVVDCDRPALYRDGALVSPTRSRFIRLARAQGAEVIDAETLFRAHLARSPLKFEVGPYDGHLNRLGVAIVAAAVAERLHAR